MTKKKVFIVDDDLDHIDALKIILEANNFDVYFTTSDANAIDEIIDKKVDIVILDVMFPDNPTTGFEICRDIKMHDQLKSLPVIILSAINEKFNMAFSSNIGEDIENSSIPADDFIEKPIKPKQLLEVINKYI